MKVFLVRHATPDWNRTDIPYDIPPGPPLSPKGEMEAEALAKFLKSQGVVKLYYSLFERSARTAQIVSSINGIENVEENRLIEWRELSETETKVSSRMKAVFDDAARESAEIGPIGLVSHGGPVAFLLQELGIDREELASYRKKFDRNNPMPPAGVWEAEWNDENNSWNLNLRFMPSVG